MGVVIQHSKHHEVYTLVKAGISVLLTGEKGTGKTTLAKDVADTLELPFCSMSMTRQTTLSHLLGFMNVNGIYIPSQLRVAVENGHLFLMDEIDASDPNVILCLNTLENGFIAFPDKVVNVHENFRLMATSNPQDNHRDYNGRTKLDASTIDRFDIVPIEKDDMLEKSLVDDHTYSHMNLIRNCLKEVNSNIYVSMRDSIRFQKRKDLGLLNNFVERLLNKNKLALEKYLSSKDSIPSVNAVEDCKTLLDVWEHISAAANQKDTPE